MTAPRLRRARSWTRFAARVGVGRIVSLLVTTLLLAAFAQCAWARREQPECRATLVARYTMGAVVAVDDPNPLFPGWCRSW